MTTDGQEIIVDCPSKLPDASKRDSISEPYCRWAWRVQWGAPARRGPCVSALAGAEAAEEVRERGSAQSGGSGLAVSFCVRLLAAGAPGSGWL
jgi:hypothetical protein